MRGCHSRARGTARGHGRLAAGLGAWTARIVRLKSALRRTPHLTGTVRRGRLGADPLGGGDPSLPKKAAVITHALDRQIRDSYNAYVVFAEASSVARAVACQRRALRREAPEDRPPRRCAARLPSSLPSSLPTAPTSPPTSLPLWLQVPWLAAARATPPCKHRSAGLPRVLGAALVAH